MKNKNKIKVVADANIPYLKGVLEPYAEVEYYTGNMITSSRIKNADALITRTRTKCNAELLDGSDVKFICSATIGFDHIDVDYCKKNNITWTNAPGCNSSSVQQYIASILVTLSKMHNFTLANRTMGVVGVGHVGKKVVSLAEYFGINVLLNDPPRMRNEDPCGFVSLDGILRDCDIITFHVPLNMSGEDKTYHMIDEKLLDKVNSGSFIINTSRGEVCKTSALKRALNSGKISGAVIDVWEGEPDIDLELLDMAEIGTPHIAGYSADGKANGTSMSVQSLSRFFNLGLNKWTPPDIPVPGNTVIKIDNTAKSFEETIDEAIYATYNIMEDDKRLRHSPHTFEEQREKYPLRREFNAYSVELTNKHREVERILRRMGFEIR